MFVVKLMNQRKQEQVAAMAHQRDQLERAIRDMQERHQKAREVIKKQLCFADKHIHYTRNIIKVIQMFGR